MDPPTSKMGVVRSFQWLLACRGGYEGGCMGDGDEVVAHIEWDVRGPGACHIRVPPPK